MFHTDPYVIVVVQSALVLFTVVALLRDAYIRILERASEVTAVITRGEKSMTPLYAVYGAALASCLVLVDKASGIDGNKVICIVIDFLCLTYLFFLSTWFRNSVFYPLMVRARKD